MTLRRKTKRAIIGRTVRRIDIAIFKECGRLWSPKTKDHGHFSCCWIAADVTAYHVAQGSTPTKAIEGLLLTLQATEQIAAESKAKGERVIRRDDRKRDEGHCQEMRKKARWLIKGVDWREWLTDLDKRYRKRCVAQKHGACGR